MIFLIRLITAACLFAFLGKANVWLNPLSNIILAFGYRLFLVFSPGFSTIFRQYAVAVALLFAAMGAALFCFENHYSLLFGAVLVGLGLSVSGYLIKSAAAETPAGAAYNKIALNIGSLLSGIIILLAIPKEFFFGGGACILLLSTLTAFVHAKNQKSREITLKIPKTLSIKKLIGWLLIGFAIGIKFFGVLSVLPQYLIKSTGKLPDWYGMTLFINSGIIIVCQLPIIHFIDRFKKNNYAMKITILIMIIGMLVIAFPHFFHAQRLLGACIWTIVLSLIECVASYLDFAGAKAGFLLIKETAIGLGAGITVLFSRYLPADISSMAIGALGIIAIIVAAFLIFTQEEEARQ